MTKRVKKEVVYVRGVPDNNNKKSEEKTPSRSTEIAAFVFCVVGIYASYMVFGIIQEQISSKKYGEEQEKFHNASFLVWVQCLANALVAYLTILYRGEKDQTPVGQYFLVSASYVGAMWASNAAIEYVNYPTMVLAKSCKPIPVLLMGVLVLRARYSLLRYICVFMITIGISIFSWQVSKGSEVENSYYGLGLLALSLCLDGITGPFQERLIIKYHPNQYHMMCLSNMWASIILGVALVITGKGSAGIHFCMKHPEVILPMIGFSVASAIGQNFIYFTIFKFGSLICTLITTTRKFFTILGSVLIFGHSLTRMQWFGVGVVFAGLTLDMFGSSSKRKKH